MDTTAPSARLGLARRTLVGLLVAVTAGCCSASDAEAKKICTDPELLRLVEAPPADFADAVSRCVPLDAWGAGGLTRTGTG